eukprot:CAMPEP_0195514316 /NCGR_PEP_ID=MMETSP0794_2-20130614/5746_1 /TAXON_ID=515487 /ORGANISM="Stephanopyxis turris, Strain CCMP 815" /LENGTH=341 /DNA_ID=CAMNT_0040642539 /DNA_START=299 /DNA_END=1324 /DNA_ORIENTATION=+
MAFDMEDYDGETSSDDFEHSRADSLYEGDCAPMQPWQEMSFPTCNTFHELDMSLGGLVQWSFAYYTSGGYNDIFKVYQPNRDDQEFVMKDLQYPDTEYTERNFDRVRRDMLIMERLTSSPYIMDIYGFCGFASMVPNGQDPFDRLEIRRNKNDSMSQMERLELATTASRALADAHNIDHDGISSITHGDFALKQYMEVNGKIKMGDFNRGRFLRWNNKLKEPCTYTIGHNDGTFRSPEEYEYLPETSAIDVWALGSIIFEILTGRPVWRHEKPKVAQKKIIKGEFPPFPEEVKDIEDSDDPVDVILLKAIKMCYIYEPKDRPKAGVVAKFLQDNFDRLRSL